MLDELEKLLSDEEGLCVAMEAYDGLNEAPFIQERDPNDIPQFPDSRRTVLTGPAGNCYPSPKRRKRFK